ncbi:MAG: CoA-binding protein [Desulfurococcales archaeon]|nr:CoA-binding protein [Desulfurococcales archaeon]
MNSRTIEDPVKATKVLKQAKTVAVIGASGTTSKDAYRVPVYLIKHGFDIIPVNPIREELYGRKAYPSLPSIPPDLRSSIDIIDVFRPPSEALRIVKDAESIRVNGKPWVIWFQWDTDTEEAVRYAVERGFIVFCGLCIKRFYSSMLRS